MKAKHKVPTGEEIRCEWLTVAETYAVAKTLRENAIEPMNRYAENETKALRESDFWLDLYIDLGHLAVKEEV